MSKHTPGTWEAVAPKRKGQHWKVGARGVLGGNSGAAGASVLWDVAAVLNGAPGDTLDTEEANARLVAAAPALLAACEQLLSRGIADASTMKRAAAAVARATPPPDGRPDP